jgi:HPt (histidine-containing phosphotransfer) domain-containing protein
MAKAKDQIADLEQRLESVQRELRAEIERLRKEGDRAWANGERLIGLDRESGHAACAQAQGLRQQADRLEGILNLLLGPGRTAAGE